MGRPTRHLLALLLVALLLASTLTPRSHHLGTPQHPGRATRIHTPQHAPPWAGGRSVALPLGSIAPCDRFRLSIGRHAADHERCALLRAGAAIAASTVSGVSTHGIDDHTADYPGAIWAPSPNYTPARRRADLRVSYVVIHDTEGSCASARTRLDNPASQASAHFLVCRDGTVYQLVHVRDIAWHAGNWYINQHSIGIEHEGFRDSGGYTQAQYDASAAIVRWLDNVYGLHIQLDRNAIFGHENVPYATHSDPGPLWDWNYYMSKVRGGTPYVGANHNVAMVVVPDATFYACPDLSCQVEGTANWGEQFALARTTSGWDEVYYNGAAAWVTGVAVTAGSGARLRVTASLAEVRTMCVWPGLCGPSSRGYVIGAIARGQVYVSRLLDRSLDDHGWWLIAYNHRYGFISCRNAQPIGQRLPAECATTPAGIRRTRP